MDALRRIQFVRCVNRNIELSKEVKRLKAEVQKAHEERDALNAAMNAVITAFFRNGASSPNVTLDCWENEKTYIIVENGEFNTIVRTEKERKKEEEILKGFCK